MRIVVIAIAALLVVGCHESGTWQDDARNWKRIFRAPKPDDVTVVHSWFWRSSHFTYEYEYYIHIEKHADLQNRLLAMNPMKEVVGEQKLLEATAWSQDRPGWFAPKPIAEYQVWVYWRMSSYECWAFVG